MESIIEYLTAAAIYIPAFLFVLTIIVFFHELGHFWAARRCGVTVDAFSIGFGREIIGWTDSKNTRWKICWIPLGGYVKFIDDMNAASTPDEGALQEMSAEERKGALQSKALWQRAFVVAAGPIASFLLAIVIFSGIYMVYGYGYHKPYVGQVKQGSPAEKAGFKSGDLILSINGNRIEEFQDIGPYVQISGNDVLKFKVLRDDKEIALEGKSAISETVDKLGNRPRQLGIYSSKRYIYQKVDPITAIGLSLKQTYKIIVLPLQYLSGTIARGEVPDQLSGPIGIADTAGKVLINIGWLGLIQLAATLSAAIGFFNLLPIPLLDGGHLAFYAVEAVRGKPLSARTQEIAAAFGLAILVTLMIFVTRLDIINRFS